MPSDSPAFGTMKKSGPEVAPASHSQQQESNRATRTSATYGRTGIGSSASAVLQDFMVSRLLPRLEQAGSTMFAYLLSRLATPSGRLILRLQASGRRTSGAEFTSWPTPRTVTGGAVKMAAWPTPMAGTPAQNGNNEAGNTDSSRKTVALVGWPTPRTVTGGAESAGRKQELGRTESGGGDLQAVAQLATWATPRGEDSECAGAHRGKADGLHSQALLTSWSTPTTRDHKDGANALEQVPVNSLLGRQVLLTDSGTPATGSPASTAKRGQLNPAHSRWLMGLPKEWDDCAPTETPSALRKRRSS